MGISELQTFLNVLASRFARPPDRSHRCDTEGRNVTDTIRATVHIPTQPGIAIAAELPQLNLRNGAFEEGEN